MMPNLLAILIAAVANMAIGFVWYGPLFAKAWMRYEEVDPKRMQEANKHMERLYIPMFVGSLVAAFVLGWLIKALGQTSVTGGAMIGALAWIGFTGTSQLANWLFSGKKIQAFFINTGYMLVSYIIMGAILGFWK